MSPVVTCAALFTLMMTPCLVQCQAEIIPVPAKLSPKSIIEEGNPMVFECNADVVGLSSNITFIDQLFLSRRLPRDKRDKLIGHYNPVHSEDSGGSSKNIPDGEDGKVNFTGGPTDLIRNNTRNMTITWKINNTKATDAGLYTCTVFYFTPDTFRNTKLRGYQEIIGPLAPRPAELTSSPTVETGKPMTLNCNASIVQLSEDTALISELKFLRKLNGQSKSELVAHYNPYNLIWTRPSMVYVPDGRDWEFSFTGHDRFEKGYLNSRNMNILWTIQDPRPTDAGVYTCEVYAFITGSKKLVIGLQHIKELHALRESYLTVPSTIKSGKPMVLKCNADVVGLPADILTVDQLKLSRKVYGQTRERLVAHYNPYNPLLANGSMTIIPDGRHWNISFHGAPEFQEDSLHSRDMNIGWVMHDPGDRDAGLYVCRVYYLSPQKSYRYVIGGQQVHASHTPRPSMLASRSLIGKGSRLNLNCNADVLGISLEVTAILTLTFSWSPDSESGETQIAVWQPYQGEDEEIKEKHIPDGRTWNISFAGAPPSTNRSNSRSMNIKWEMTDVRTSDAGLYICNVSYLNPDAFEPDYTTGHQIIQGCPADYKLNLNNKQCYWLSNSTQKLGYMAAHNYCKENGGGLASVKSTFETRFLQRMKGRKIPAWIGLDRIKSVKVTKLGKPPDGWVWRLDGTLPVYKNWYMRNPKPRGRRAYNCAVMTKRARWFSLKCYKKRRFFCQASPLKLA